MNMADFKPVYLRKELHKKLKIMATKEEKTITNKFNEMMKRQLEDVDIDISPNEE